MLFAAEMGPAVTRSSMEQMLDAIRLREEWPEGAPPALPARPTSRGRLPSSVRPLPVHPRADIKPPELLLNDSEKKEEKVVVSKSGIFGSKRIRKWDLWGRPEESLYAKMPELESYDGGGEEDNGPDSLAAPSHSPDVKPGWDDTTDCVLNKIASVEDARNQTLQWILYVQKRFRGLQVRRSFQEFKKGVTTLQSIVRGEGARHRFDYMVMRWKAVVVIQKHVKRWVAMKAFADQQKDIIHIQSVIRGWMARRNFIVVKNLEIPKLNRVKNNRDSGMNLQEMKDNNEEHPQVCSSVMAELQTRVLRAETALRQKEEENVMLQQKLQQYDSRWSEHEAKMKAMEEKWQKQLTSLQLSLVEARKSLLADDTASQPRRVDESPNNRNFDSEDTMSAETQTPQGTPAMQPRASDPRLSRNSEGHKNAVSHLVGEFEQRRRIFEDDAGFLLEVKSRMSVSTMNPTEELRELKSRLAAWNKDYKARLRETKAALRKIDGSRSDKVQRKWWGTSCAR